MKRVRVTQDSDTWKTVICYTGVVGAVSVPITALPFAAMELTNAMGCTISAHGNGITFLISGDVPTAVHGIELAAGGTATIIGNEDINDLQMIRSGVADATVTVCLSWSTTVE